MPLLDSWTVTNSTQGGTSVALTFQNAVPANRWVVLAIGRGGGSTSVTASNVAGNVWTVERVGPHTSNTVCAALLTMFTANAISAGSSVTLTFGASSNRTAAVFGVFDSVSPLSKVVMPAVLSTAQPAVNCGPTPELITPRALVITVAASTSGNFPLSNSGNKLVAQAVTAGGSADRGVALFYKNEGGYTHTGSFLVPSSGISVSATMAVQTPELPAGYLPVMTAEGEVPGRLSHWTGTSEVLATSLGLS